MSDCSCNNFPASLGNVSFGASVGIGTASPDAKLHVWGNFKVGDLGGAGTRQALEIDPANADLYVGSATQSGDIFVRRASDGAASARIGGAGANSYLNVHGGRVGILTAAPQGGLHLLGTLAWPDQTVPPHGEIGGATAYRLVLNGGEPGIILSGASAGVEDRVLGLQIGIYTATDIRPQLYYGGQAFEIVQITPNASQVVGRRLVVDTSGRVGIGTTTPSEQLEVAGNVKLTGQVIAMQVIAMQVIAQAQQAGDPTVIRQPLPGSADEGGEIRFVGAGTWPYFYLDSFQGRLRFVSKDVVGESEKVTITNGGRVGIRVVNPRGPLEVGPDNPALPDEGGEIWWAGGGSNRYFYIDNFQGRFRLVTQDATNESPKVTIENNGDVQLNTGQLRCGSRRVADSAGCYYAD